MSEYIAGILAFTGINILMALSVYAVLTTGQVSIGNAGFMAVGAYMSSALTVLAKWPLLPALLVGALVAAAVGVFVGFPALRLRGLYLVLATIGFGEMVRTIFLNLTIVGGASGFRGISGGTVLYIYVAVILALAAFEGIHRSRLMLAFDAVRADERVAAMMGMNVTWLKVGAFGFGAFIAGLSGGLYAHYVFYIEPSNFTFMHSTAVVLAVILGGMYTYWGGVLGAVLFTVLPELLRFMGQWRFAVWGLLLMLVMVVRRDGLITRPMLAWLGARLNRRARDRRRQEVPAA